MSKQKVSFSLVCGQRQHSIHDIISVVSDYIGKNSNLRIFPVCLQDVLYTNILDKFEKIIADAEMTNLKSDLVYYVPIDIPLTYTLLRPTLDRLGMVYDYIRLTPENTENWGPNSPSYILVSMKKEEFEKLIMESEEKVFDAVIDGILEFKQTVNKE